MPGALIQVEACLGQKHSFIRQYVWRNSWCLHI